MTVDQPVFTHAQNIVNAWTWKDEVKLEVINSGLINRSFGVRSGGRLVAVLQHINPSIVPPEVNEDIETITSWLTQRGITTPRLIRTREGELWVTDDEGEKWRCLTHVGQSSIDTFTSSQQARSAARLVARFHTALKDLDAQLRSPRLSAQDTEKHLANLRSALAAHHDHRLYERIAPIADHIEGIWAKWQGPGNLPIRIIHGDLKLSNIRFNGDEAVALIDLDTLANSTLDAELGDALRSWCNPAGEDTEQAVFDLDIFRAAMFGFGDDGCDNFATEAEWASIIPGFERITLNLTARFAADALQECYFGWHKHYGGSGEHNLIRAQGQLNLLDSVLAHRASMEEILRRVTQK